MKLDKFSEFKQAHHNNLIEYIKRVGEKYNYVLGHINFKEVEPERDYALPLGFSDAEAVFYIVVRNSG